jgi:phosphatidate phosphatase LPIN
MKLGEGGEAFFVFETTDDIPESLQTSPLVSPATSPKSSSSGERDAGSLQEPDYLDLSTEKSNFSIRNGSATLSHVPMPPSAVRAKSDLGMSAAVVSILAVLNWVARNIGDTITVSRRCIARSWHQWSMVKPS